MKAPSEKARGIVTSVLVDALGVDEEEVTPTALLFDQLGAESIDLLDIQFRLERAANMKLGRDVWKQWTVDGLEEGQDYDVYGSLTDSGRRKLQEKFPGVEFTTGRLIRIDRGILPPLTAGMLMSYLDEHGLQHQDTLS